MLEPTEDHAINVLLDREKYIREQISSAKKELEKFTQDVNDLVEEQTEKLKALREALIKLDPDLMKELGIK